MKHIEKIFDVENNVEFVSERDFTEEELTHFKTNELELKNRIKENEERNLKKQELLNKLGITSDEIQYLLG